MIVAVPIIIVPPPIVPSRGLDATTRAALVQQIGHVLLVLGIVAALVVVAFIAWNIWDR